MGAGAKGQTRIEAQVDRLRVRWLLPAGADPQAFTALDGFKVLHPGSFPELVLQGFPVQIAGLVVGQQGKKICADQLLVGRQFKQGGDLDRFPQWRFADPRFEDGVVGVVRESDGDSAALKQCIFHLLGAVATGFKVDLEPGHGIGRA